MTLKAAGVTQIHRQPGAIKAMRYVAADHATYAALLGFDRRWLHAAAFTVTVTGAAWRGHTHRAVQRYLTRQFGTAPTSLRGF